MPSVSIIMTSYNYDRYIGAAITSVLLQNWTDWELLVVDDGSIDSSLSVIKDFVRKDRRIHLLRHPDGGNHGLIASLLLGLKTAKAPLLAFLESDDSWNANCLERRLHAFAHFNADVVFNNAELILTDGCNANSRIRYLRNLDLRFPREGQVNIQRHIWFANVLPSFSSVMIRTSILQECDFSAPVAPWLDWWLWFQLAPQAKFVYLNAKLTRWRVHARSYSASMTGVHALKKYMLLMFCTHAQVPTPRLATLLYHLPAPSVALYNACKIRYLLARHILFTVFRHLFNFLRLFRI